MTSVETLPDEVLVHILSYLNPWELAKAERVSKAFRQCCQDNWKNINLCLRFEFEKVHVNILDENQEIFSSHAVFIDDDVLKNLFQKCITLKTLDIQMKMHKTPSNLEKYPKITNFITDYSTPVTNLRCDWLTPAVASLIQACSSSLRSFSSMDDRLLFRRVEQDRYMETFAALTECPNLEEARIMGYVWMSERGQMDNFLAEILNYFR